MKKLIKFREWKENIIEGSNEADVLYEVGSSSRRIGSLVEGHLGQFPHFIVRTSEGHYE